MYGQVAYIPPNIRTWLITLHNRHEDDIKVLLLHANVKRQ